jgi:hypothetical protein
LDFVRGGRIYCGVAYAFGEGNFSDFAQAGEQQSSRRDARSAFALPFLQSDAACLESARILAPIITAIADTRP